METFLRRKADTRRIRAIAIAPCTRGRCVSRPSSLWRPTKCAWMIGRRPGAPCSDTANTSVPWHSPRVAEAHLRGRCRRVPMTLSIPRLPPDALEEAEFPRRDIADGEQCDYAHHRLLMRAHP